MGLNDFFSSYELRPGTLSIFAKLWEHSRQPNKPWVFYMVAQPKFQFRRRLLFRSQSFDMHRDQLSGNSKPFLSSNASSPAQSSNKEYSALRGHDIWYAAWLSMIKPLQHTHWLYKCLQYLFPTSHQTGQFVRKELPVFRARVPVFIGLSGIRYYFETNNTVWRQRYLCRHSPIINLTFDKNYLSLIFRKIFRKINDFVHKFILDHKSVDFTILIVNFTILYC
jgi:hypothetical protein